MNTPNNKRRKDSQNRIEQAFVKEIQSKELSQITVTNICKEAGVNRSTFYANYVDIYNLADKVQKRLEDEVFALYEKDSYDFLSFFRHVKDNQLFYKTYFKLGLNGRLNFTERDIDDAIIRYNDKNIEYHFEFFRNGLNAIIKKWLDNGCRETSEEMYEVVSLEYAGRGR